MGAVRVKVKVPVAPGATLVSFKSAVDTEDFQAFYESSASNLHSEHTPETIKSVCGCPYIERAVQT